MTSTIDQQTEDTLALIAKAQTTGITSSTGVQSYDLAGIVSLIPVVHPLRDVLPRVASNEGNKIAIWRAFLNLTSSQPSPLPGLDYAGNEVLVQEQDFQSPYANIAYAGFVTQDALDLAKGLTDPYADQTLQTLNNYLIGEDRVLMGAQNYALAQPGTITKSTATTGGSIAASTTVYIGVAARTGYGYYYGGNSQGTSTSQATGSGTSTNTVTGTIAAVKGATAYDWFQSANGTTWYYYTTTTTGTVTMTSVISANNALPSSTVCPDLYTTVPTYNGSADNGSAVSTAPNGLIASLTGDYSSAGVWSTPGTQTSNPAVFLDGGGSALTLSGGSIAQVESLFAGVWNQVKTSPTAIMVNAIDAQNIANLILGSTSATTFLNTDASGRVSAVAGGRVGEVVNTPAGGVTVPIEVHTSLPPGTIIARTDRVPFPSSNISSTIQVRTLRDTSQFDYGINRTSGSGGGPRKEFEIKSIEALVNYAPVAMASITNVQ